MRLVLCMLLLALVGGCGWKSAFDNTGNNGSGKLSPNHYIFFSNNGDPVGGLNSPTAVAYDSKGYIYVADTGNNRIVKYTTGGTYILQFGSGVLSNPQGLTVDNNGRVYVADPGNGCIRQYDGGSGNLLDTWSATGAVAGLKYYNGSIYAAITTAPVHIQQYSLTGSKILVWGETPAGQTTPVAGALTLPVGIAFLGNFAYVLDQGPEQINKYTLGGVYQNSSVAGAFLYPAQIDALNNKIYIADTGNFIIDVYTDIVAAPTTITTSQTDIGQDTQPAGVAVDNAGLMYVAERNANRIEVLKPL